MPGIASMFTIKLQNDKKNPTLQVPDSIRKKYIKQVNKAVFEYSDVGDNLMLPGICHQRHCSRLSRK